MLSHVARGEVAVFTDPVASPTGFPFKVVQWDDDPARRVERARVCDLGYLRTAYQRADGRLGYRCASEPVATYLKKGGEEAETEGRKCLCNGLMASIGLAQVRKDATVEPPLVTSGDDLVLLGELLQGRSSYTAAEAIAWLTSDVGAPAT